MVRSSFGTIRELPSGRWQARYTGPDRRKYKAPTTFATKREADSWLAGVRADLLRGAWTPAAGTAPTRAPRLDEYAPRWLRDRRTSKGAPLRQRTRDHYADLMGRFILPGLGNYRLDELRPEHVSDWYADLETGETFRAHAYSLLRTILNSAVDEDIIAKNPCRIRGGGRVERTKRIEPATLAELRKIEEAMPPHLRLTVSLAAWGALRFGEIAELRRKDIDLHAGVVKVRRAVTRAADGTYVVGPPKTAAGVRDVAMPPHTLPNLEDHLNNHTGLGPNALLFPARDGRQLAHSALMWHFEQARAIAGRPDLTFHGLRHTGATLAAHAGATVRELQDRLGHTTASMALRYQHTASGRDARLARELSRLAELDPQ